jgi:nitroreductase
MGDGVRNVLEAAIRAPSGENAQPWHFNVQENGDVALVDVHISKKREQSLYGWGDRASYVAVGAAIENMRITAPEYGLSSEITILPEQNDASLAARIRLAPAIQQKDILYEAIFQRSTNRKAYETTPLSDAEQASLKSEAHKGGGELRFVDTYDAKKKLADVGSYNERIMLANPTLHNFFFGHVNWTKAQDEARKVGFFIDTLELPFPAKIGFKVMSSWKRAQKLNTYLKFNEMAAAQNALTYASCGAFGTIVSKGESARDAIEAGRAMERVWLEATRLGLSIQPMVGVVYLSLGVEAGTSGDLSPDDISLIKKGVGDVRSIFSLGSLRTYFVFRIGKAKAPTARSVRFSIDEVSTFQS